MRQGACCIAVNNTKGEAQDGAVVTQTYETTVYELSQTSVQMYVKWQRTLSLIPCVFRARPRSPRGSDLHTIPMAYKNKKVESGGKMLNSSATSLKTSMYAVST